MATAGRRRAVVGYAQAGCGHIGGSRKGSRAGRWWSHSDSRGQACYQPTLGRYFWIVKTPKRGAASSVRSAPRDDCSNQRVDPFGVALETLTCNRQTPSDRRRPAARPRWLACELNEQAKPLERGGRGEREERQKNLKRSALFAPSAFNGLEDWAAVVCTSIFPVLPRRRRSATRGLRTSRFLG